MQYEEETLFLCSRRGFTRCHTRSPRRSAESQDTSLFVCEDYDLGRLAAAARVGVGFLARSFMLITGFIAAVLFAAVAILATDLALAPWIAAQLVKALCPWTSTFATKAEAWAWARWDEERRGFRIAPEQVEELAVGTAAPSLTRPWIIRGILNASGSTPQSKALRDYNWLLDSPVGDIEVDYFSNASAEDGIVPDARAPLRTIVNGILAGGNAKIGTEMIFRSFPQVIASDCL